MNKFYLAFLLTLITAASFSQSLWGIDFDTPQYLDRVYNDTVSNSNCIWQIGHPDKTVFTSAYSALNAIVTDTLNPVPANDTSVFYLKHVRDNNFQPFHVFALHFWYQMNGDSTDFGMVEISPDTGQTWINVLTQDTTFLMNWISPKPILTGSTNGWQSFELDMMTWASALNFGSPILPIYMTADTILFRFTYITNSSSTPYDGWIIDDIYLEDWAEGIPEIHNDNLITLSPNPTSTELKIQRTKATGNQKIQIFDFQGQILYENLQFSGESVDVRKLPNGIYLLKYSDMKYLAVKKFIVEH